MNELELVLINLAGLLKEPAAKASITSAELAKKLSASQQTASRYLIRLEKEGLITRSAKGHKQEIQLTEKGIGALQKLSYVLSGFFSKKQKLVLAGVVASGLGEGAYYIKQYEWKILHALGFHPYPGTLNIHLNSEKPDLSAYASNRIEGFSQAGRHFGALDIIPIELETKGIKIDCFIAVPERTHHKRDVEVVSQFNLRSKYGIRDGDTVALAIK